MSEIQRHAVIETALCIGDSLHEGEVLMVRADEHDRELAALREELAQSRILAADQGLNLKRVKREFDASQQRLTTAEQRNVVQRGLLHRALNVIRGMRYDELEAAIVEELNIPTESGASE